ncbi:MAG: nitroreductase family protein [Actinomycetota bacterium]
MTPDSGPPRASFANLVGLPVAFIRAVVADVRRELRIDRRRISIAGFSNGAQMAHRLAAEAGDVFAAGAGWGAGAGQLCRSDPFRPSRNAIPFWAGMGSLDDRHTPLNGGSELPVTDTDAIEQTLGGVLRNATCLFSLQRPRSGATSIDDLVTQPHVFDRVATPAWSQVLVDDQPVPGDHGGELLPVRHPRRSRAPLPERLEGDDGPTDQRDEGRHAGRAPAPVPPGQPEATQTTPLTRATRAGLRNGDAQTQEAPGLETVEARAGRTPPTPDHPLASPTMDIVDLIASRRSVGRIPPDPVPRETVAEILTAAIRAPNHHLTAPWRFVVLTGAARRALGDAHARAVAAARPDLPDGAREKEAARLDRAPVVIACIARATSDDPVTRREDRDAVAAAVQNLLLAAAARDLAAIWRTGAMVDEEEVRDHLGLAPADAIVAFVYLGRHDGAARPATPRPPLDDVVEWRE